MILIFVMAARFFKLLIFFLTISTSSFFHLLVNGFSVTCFQTFFADPLPSLN